MTGTQWLAMASKRRFDDGVSPAMLRQNLEERIPCSDSLIPPCWTLPNAKCTSFSSFNILCSCCLAWPPWTWEMIKFSYTNSLIEHLLFHYTSFLIVYDIWTLLTILQAIIFLPLMWNYLLRSIILFQFMETLFWSASQLLILTIYVLILPSNMFTFIELSYYEYCIHNHFLKLYTYYNLNQIDLACEVVQVNLI